MYKLALLATIVAVLGQGVTAKTDKLVCYHGTWSTYLPGASTFNLEDIDPFVCTHLIYSYVGLNEDGSLKLLDSHLDITEQGFERFNNLKKINPKLKTLLAVGGFNEDSAKYSDVAANPALRKVFLDTTLEVLLKYGFDGFDIDWEYPGQRSGRAEDKYNLNVLLKEFREAFDKHGLLLTVAVAPTPSQISVFYDVPELSNYVDFINVMTYNLYDTAAVTRQHTGLYPASTDITPAQKELNVDASIKAWIANGAAPEKIVLGLAAYGIGYNLVDVNNNGVGAPTVGSAAGGLSYNKFCIEVEEGWIHGWSEEQKVPYAYKGKQWVGYENQKSLGIKVEYAKELGLGGLMLWSVESDDFTGNCGRQFGLLHSIREVLGF